MLVAIGRTRNVETHVQCVEPPVAVIDFDNIGRGAIFTQICTSSVKWAALKTLMFAGILTGQIAVPYVFAQFMGLIRSQFAFAIKRSRILNAVSRAELPALYGRLDSWSDVQRAYMPLGDSVMIPLLVYKLISTFRDRYPDLNSYRIIENYKGEPAVAAPMGDGRTE